MNKKPDFSSIMTKRLQMLMFYPLRLLWRLVSFVLAQLDPLEIWDYLGLFWEASIVFMLSLMGLQYQFKVHTQGCILVTEANSGIENLTEGIGIDIATKLAKDGFHVFAAVNSHHNMSEIHQIVHSLPSKLRDNIIPTVINLSNQIQIAASVKIVEATFLSLPPNARNLIGIINCSRNTDESLAPIETITQKSWIDAFTFNTVGPMCIISAFLPLLRNSQGRIINISCAGASTSSPLEGPFSASKLALEAASDSLRIELHRWRIPVALIISGSLDINSKRPKNAQISTEMSTLYKPLIRGVAGVMRESKGYFLEGKYCTKAIMHALFSETPCTRYNVGADAKMTAWMKWILNDRIRDCIYDVYIQLFDETAETRVQFK